MHLLQVPGPEGVEGGAEGAGPAPLPQVRQVRQALGEPGEDGGGGGGGGGGGERGGERLYVAASDDDATAEYDAIIDGEVDDNEGVDKDSTDSTDDDCNDGAKVPDEEYPAAPVLGHVGG